MSVHEYIFTVKLLLYPSISEAFLLYDHFTYDKLYINGPAYSNYTMSFSSKTNYLYYNQGNNTPGLVWMKAS